MSGLVSSATPPPPSHTYRICSRPPQESLSYCTTLAQPPCDAPPLIENADLNAPTKIKTSHQQPLMEPQINHLVEKTWSRYQSLPQNNRLLISISGIPGSGKTTLAITVTQRLNALHRASSPPSEAAAEPDIATFVPMDGYHYTRAHLSSMPDPELAHARRGAHWTFDAPAFLSLVQALRAPLTPAAPTIHAPSFSHSTKDPVEDDIPIPPTSRVLIFEGNYLSLNREPWSTAAGLMDELWFVEVDFQVARRRLVGRHVAAGIARDEEEAGRRADGNDLVNGEEIVRERLEVQEVVKSVEDEGWAEPAGVGVGVDGGERT
ncbi:hypothetical protein FGG08_002051 [Glutinoglossum americanum]|uniref:Phosphoribulokinase/uridine kinase domain-containing protein n=1 Tax=Glutinoglossum americanum TaxID=1670608 RepID=A0A9P8I9X1_9PEZI|nr:hypothetical protein FGG08_002051 [Glutinoglossum americanum]